jgi:hypothetical protein
MLDLENAEYRTQEIDQDQNERNYQRDMNESSHGIPRPESNHPENQQHNSNYQ